MAQQCRLPSTARRNCFEDQAVVHQLVLNSFHFAKHDRIFRHPIILFRILVATGAVKKYQEFNGFFPEKFVMYRDGVSDGQVSMVLEHEVDEMYDAIREITGKDPKLCYTVVNKRINTRFYTPKPGGRGFVNPIHGCVVDNEVTRPERVDFFLVSQSVNQGTVAPTQYVIIKDTLGIPPDYHQRLAYKMTHMYYNWPVSLIFKFILYFFVKTVISDIGQLVR